MRSSRTLALLLVALAGPAAAEIVVRPQLALSVTGTTKGAVSLPVGDTLLVVLPGQPATGFAWQPDLEPTTSLAAIEARCPEPSGGRVGGIEPVCFAWHAAAPGDAIVSFHWIRHWETQPGGLLRYQLAVTVEPAG